MQNYNMQSRSTALLRQIVGKSSF